MSTQEKREPVEYTVLEKSLIGNEIFEAGAVAKYDGLPAENLQPMCDVGRARHQEYLASNVERVRVMKEQNAEPGIGDPAAFMAAFRKELAESQASQAQVIAEAIAAAFAKFAPVAAPAPKGKAAAAADPIA